MVPVLLEALIQLSKIHFKHPHVVSDVFRYYAVVCLPGLHILSRMRRERALAVDDSQVGEPIL